MRRLSSKHKLEDVTNYCPQQSDYTQAHHSSFNTVVVWVMGWGLLPRMYQCTTLQIHVTQLAPQMLA
jgi:ribosomal protein L32